jgi:predicted nucleotidyltransferase
MLKLEEIKSILKAEKKELASLGIKDIGIFGSYIRGDAEETSDIDILVDVSPDSSLTLFSLINIEMKLSEKFNRKVDLVIKSDLKPNMGKRILREVEYV